MKIRIADNQIRFRIQPNEQEQLLDGSILENQLYFPANPLKFTLKVGHQPSHLANFKNNSCIIELHKLAAEAWRKNPKEIIKFTQEESLGNSILICVELDLMRDK